LEPDYDDPLARSSLLDSALDCPANPWGDEIEGARDAPAAGPRSADVGEPSRALYAQLDLDGDWQPILWAVRPQDEIRSM
jgi:hypothetical protein